MRKNKFVKLLEHILVLLPMFFVASVCLYTIMNENAYQSYSDIRVVSNVAIQNQNEMTIGTKYHMTYKEAPNQQNTLKVNYISFTKEELNVTQGVYESINFILLQPNGTLRFSNQSAPTTWLATKTWDNTISFDFIMDGENPYANSNWLQCAFINQIVIGNNTLDTAFTYSLNQFNQLGFDRINWVNWFTSIFITENNVYVTFLNSYLNYFLLVECCYVVPMVMYWFIHFCEHVLYKFENWGDNV